MIQAEQVKQAMAGRWLDLYEQYTIGRMKPTSGGWYSCRCPLPSHGGEDRNPSFSANEMHGGYKCFAEDDEGDPFDFVVAMNKARDFPGAVQFLADFAGLCDDAPQPKRTGKSGELVTVYDYVDENGNLLFQTVRTDTSEGKKMEARDPNGKKGIGSTRRVLYNLPAVLRAKEAGERIYIVEGEKCAESLIQKGLVATTNPFGSHSKWEDSYTESLKGASDIVFLPDNDEPGRKLQQKVVDALKNKVKKLRVVKLPGLPEKGDIYDWLDAGGTIEQLSQIVESTPDWSAKQLETLLPQTFTAADIFGMEFPEPVWVVPGLIPAGLTVLAGKPKLGKSWLALSIALSLAQNGAVLGKIQVQQMQSLYLALEDTKRRIQDRMRQMEVKNTSDLSNLHFQFDWRRGQEGADDIDLYLQAHPGVKLVIIDTLQKFRDPKSSNSTNMYAADYETVGSLKRVADKHDAAIVIVHHVRKGVSEDPLELISGSFGISGAADTLAVLNRGRGQVDGTLFITGRDVEEQDLALERDPRIGWSLLGDADKWNQTKERRNILEVLEDSPSPIGPKDIADLTGLSYDSVRQLLAKMTKDGVIERKGRGSYQMAETVRRDPFTKTNHIIHNDHKDNIGHNDHNAPKAQESLFVNGKQSTDHNGKLFYNGRSCTNVSVVNVVNEAAVTDEKPLKVVEL